MNLHSLSCRGCSQVGTTDSITVGSTAASVHNGVWFLCGFSVNL